MAFRAITASTLFAGARSPFVEARAQASRRKNRVSKACKHAYLRFAGG